MLCLFLWCTSHSHCVELANPSTGISWSKMSQTIFHLACVTFMFSLWGLCSTKFCDLVLQQNVQGMDSACQFRKYFTEDVVYCLNQMNSFSKKRLQFVFVGDSRIRQQFYSFLELIPDYDFSSEELEIKNGMAHHDMAVESSLLNVKISFNWDPIVKPKLFDELTSVTSNQTTFVLIGISAHYMLQRNGASHKLFEENMILIEPLIRNLSAVAQVIWFNQVPVIEMYAGNGFHNTDIFSEKIEQYNLIARKILRNSSAIFWESFVLPAEFYINACRLNAYRNDLVWFYKCRDYIHTGAVAVRYGTQMIFNHLCNRHM